MFVWRYLDGEGGELGASERFVSRESAEAWMAEAWVGLSERGVEQVALVDEERAERLYRMSLAEG